MESQTIYLVERYWYDNRSLLGAFTSKADAAAFIEYEKGYRERWHYTVHEVELHSPLTPAPLPSPDTHTNG